LPMKDFAAVQGRLNANGVDTQYMPLNDSLTNDKISHWDSE